MLAELALIALRYLHSISPGRPRPAPPYLGYPAAPGRLLGAWLSTAWSAPTRPHSAGPGASVSAKCSQGEVDAIALYC